MPASAATTPKICTSQDQPALAATLSRQIARALRGTEATVSIAVDDSDEDLRCRYHQWQEFHSASVIKVITLGALLYQLRQAHESLDPYQDALATAMITQSDNDAQDELWNEIGMPALQAFVTAARMNQGSPSLGSSSILRSAAVRALATPSAGVIICRMTATERLSPYAAQASG